MSRIRDLAAVVLMGLCASILARASQDAAPPPPAPAPAAQQAEPSPDQTVAPPASSKLIVTVGKSLIIDSPLNIVRVHVANGTLAEAVAVNPKEVLINGIAAGETSLIVWQQNGARLVYDLTVRMSSNKLEAVRQQIARDFPQEDINVTFENDTAFVRGTVKDVTAADRVMTIAATVGKAVNLLKVSVPGTDPQVVLKVKFANVDRQAAVDFSANFWNASFNQQSSLGTGYALFPDERGKFPVPSPVNLLFLRPDINLVAELQALETKRVLEILAEPNLLAISGEQASFLAGGEFPFPVVQPSSTGVATVTIMWREYGVRLNFQPFVTQRGTIRLKVQPEVSSLDYTNSVAVQGVTIPGLATRRVSTECEVDSGQSFVIAGLLDNQTTDNFSRVPGIGNIPVLGKLFQSKHIQRSSSELLVIITPEIVRPANPGTPLPQLNFPRTFLPTNTTALPVHPGMDKTGPAASKPPVDSLPYEMVAPKKDQASAPVSPAQMLQQMMQPPPQPAGGSKQ